MDVLITGANGFMGRSLSDFLLEKSEYSIRVAVRKKINSLKSASCKQFITGTVTPETDWSEALAGCECIIHFLGRAHILNEKSEEPLAEFRRVNVENTLNLAHQAVKAGIKRFIFLSSIGVNGNETSVDEKFTEKNSPNPQTDYAVSKLEAEQGLLEVARTSTMEVVIIRPPLTYGPSSKGNFALLIKLVQLGLPLPFASIHNKKSFVSIYNLCDFIELCIRHPEAKNQVFLISDGNDLSTAEFCRLLADSFRTKLYFVPMPLFLLNFFGILLRKKQTIHRLVSSLQIDISHAKAVLGWNPPFSIQESLAIMQKDNARNNYE